MSIILIIGIIGFFIVLIIIRSVLINFIDKKADQKFEEEFNSKTNSFIRLFISASIKNKLNDKYTADKRIECKNRVNTYITNITKADFFLGSYLAIVISYTAWHSIFWAILHGLFSWGYVIYYAIRYP